jgi:glycosyltransferase involved in cell wall biosynthesis
LAERIKQVYVAAGLDAHRISVVPNPGNSVVRSQDPGNGRALFVGRLGIEKGILEVIEAWPESESLDIVGDGPLANKVASLSRSNINYLGPMQHDSVVEAMSKYSALVVPSLWTESAPMVVVEALSTGLPIVSLRDNVVGDAITRLQIGVVIEALNSADISNALKEIRIQGESLRTHCRLVFEGEFTRDKWMERLGLVYEKAIDQNALGQVPHA